MADEGKLTILVCGASGLIGRAVCARLATEGHVVLRGVRHVGSNAEVAIDYSRDLRAEDWIERLRGVDAVVNAVGIITEQAGASFEALHAQAPAALFTACSAVGVRRVVQISALGAGSGDTAYFATKRAADEALMALPLEWTVLRPSLVFGLDGASTAMFCRLASTPVLLSPALPGARFQPVHIDDLVDAVVRALDPAEPARRVIDVAGPTALSFDEMLAGYRRAMDLSSAPILHVPAPLMACAAWVGQILPGSPLTPATWRMLQAGSALAPEQAQGGLCRRAIDDVVNPVDGELLRLRALAAWRKPMLRWLLAIVWLATALVSAFIYPRDDSLDLLRRVGIEGWPATVALYGAVGLDAGFGIACIALPGRALWLAQGALILAYSAAIALCLPEFLWHPFGPVLKNVPILGILFILYAEEKAWTT